VNGATASSTDGITPRQENKKRQQRLPFFIFIFSFKTWRYVLFNAGFPACLTFFLTLPERLVGGGRFYSLNPRRGSFNPDDLYSEGI
jgi:hypothetical protein